MATSKKCSKCEQVKPLEDFCVHPKGLYGRHSRCKQCQSDHAKLRYANDPEHRQRSIARAKTAAQGERAKAWRKQYWSRVKGSADRKASRNEYMRALYHSDPIHRMKIKARQLVGWALKKGKLTKPDRCEQCGRECKELEGHHYAGYWPRVAWLMVRWLCPECHVPADMAQPADKLFIGFGLPELAEYEAKVSAASTALGLDQKGILGATLECLGEDECEVFLNVIGWLGKNGYTIQKE